ncbi:MAG TPA: terminase family protein [Polyangiaceae bacterium]|nr:terminase family protein [Polyangiaceae bacterium]
MTLTLADWRDAELRIAADAVPDGSPLIDLLPADFLAELSELEALALRHSPEAWLRPAQLPPTDEDWLVWLMLCGRGHGKSTAAAGWIIQQVLAGDPKQPADFALIAPTIDEVWALQWRVISDLLPPWIRVTERVSRNAVLFPDHGLQLLMHSAEVSEYRGPNLRGAWIEEPVKFPRGEELWSNVRAALRVAGKTPPRAVITTTPPRELDWILELATESTTRVTRGRMRDNPMLDRRAVDAVYKARGATADGRRELDGEVIIGVENSICKQHDIDAHRVASVPRLNQVVIAVDPAQSAKRDADEVGIVAVGEAGGHLYVLESSIAKLEPFDWASRAVQFAERHSAGRYVVEPTGSGSYPRATLTAQLSMMHARRLQIVDSKAHGSKADRAAPLSAACAGGRLHIVGRQEALERDLTSWHPRANWSPAGLDALVHGASFLTNEWRTL